MTDALEKLRPAAEDWIAARDAEALERTRISARSGQTGGALGTHPALQPFISERRDALAHLFASILTSLRKGEEHSPALMTIWNDYPELDRSQPHRDTPPGKRSQAQQKDVARWVTGRKALTEAVLDDLGLPTNLSVTPVKERPSRPAPAPARPKPRPSDEQIAAEMQLAGYGRKKDADA